MATYTTHLFTSIDKEECVSTFLTKQVDGPKHISFPHLVSKGVRMTKTTRKAWHGKGRWLLLIVTTAGYMFAAHQHNAQVKRDLWQKFYHDEITDVQYYSAIKTLNF